MPLHLYQRGRIWHYRGSVAGRRLRGSTKTARREIAEQFVSAIEAREWKSRLDGPAAVLTFAEAAILYRQAGKAERYLRTVEDHWKDTPVRQITSGAVRQASIQLYPMAKAATRNRQFIVPTQAIINHAAEMELCAHLRVKRFPVIRRAKEPATWEWIQAFMASAIAEPAHNHRLAALACTMFLTGAATSEALAIDWEEVNFRASRVLIRRSKTGVERWAHMPPEMIAALANLPGDRTGKVFSFKSKSSIKTQWENAIRRAGIVRLTPHSCRHGFATGLLAAGVNPMDVAKRGGWKSAQHVFQTYGHATEDATVVEVLTGAKRARKFKKASGIK